MITNPLTGEPLLDHKEVAELLGVHRNTISNWIKNGIIPSIKIGKRKTRIPKWQMQLWLNRTFGGNAMLSDEDAKQIGVKPSQGCMAGDIEKLEGDALLEEMEMRSGQALACCGVALDNAYPCFEKTIEVKLKDTKSRVPEQVISCNVAAYLGDSSKPKKVSKMADQREGTHLAEEQFEKWLRSAFFDHPDQVCLHWDASFTPVQNGFFAAECKDCDTDFVSFAEFLSWVRRSLKLSGGKATVTVGDTEYMLEGTELVGHRYLPFDSPEEVEVTIGNGDE